ncbi:proton-coupled amino acid transporter-like protein pathetic isoform X2 [Ctenocephalides felis]|uniref:proton-coupled amino acid transporter-like protein pathetic isoform X2 n=1 Tax=Ctenocephalides felis TaxID=7515 RepID=UPI000E6E5042|nr:proton-coupled amino acid transporter-like protein pathetic isoform X2 [Ctenocephalides felis]XP_026472243.1 proton-coupled amino acid transporter-like protein pathetic isoform X2 [Ctenocephalides felis]
MVSEANGQPPHELETFLPQDKADGKYKVNVSQKDAEALRTGDYDPFKERKLEHPTTDGETLTHLLKASLGTGILAMPFAFMNCGLVLGIFFTILVAFICTHCSYVLVKCAHTLYRRTRVSAMGFAEVAEVAFQKGPEPTRKYGYGFRLLILNCLFLTYFGTCSVYSVIVAKNFQQVIEHHTGNVQDDRIYIAVLLLPLILLCWVPNLKYLAPISMLANVFMGLGLGITFYYLVMETSEISDRKLVAEAHLWPQFFSISIFAMEAIGVVMPLENQMKTPQNFVGLCGVLNQGMSGVTLIYILLGFMGYVAYGDSTLGAITLNLPTDEILAQSVKILIALAVYCTFGLQFYVCLEIVWNAIKDNFTKRPLLVNYILRTVLVTLAVVVAVAVPTIGPFIGLIGAFCFSILGLLVPVMIETVTYWEEGFGKFNWVVWKNVVITVFGIFALIFGSQSAINDIVTMYTSGPGQAPVLNGTTMALVNETVSGLMNSTTGA